MNTESRSTGNQKRELAISRVFNAPRELVWKAWTEPDRFAQWYGLPNSTLSNVEMDVRPGGSWSAVTHIPNTPDIFWKADYREVVEPERLMFALRNPDNHDDPSVEIVTVTFERMAGKTRMIFTQAGNLPQEQYEKQLRQGWNSFFDRLDKVLKKT